METELCQLGQCHAKVKKVTEEMLLLEPAHDNKELTDRKRTLSDHRVLTLAFNQFIFHADTVHLSLLHLYAIYHYLN